MTLWQTQCPWWTQCPPHSLSPLSSVPPSRSCWTAHRHGDIATERLKSEKNHAFIFILVPIFKYPVNWPTLMASGIAGGRKQFFLRSSKTNVPEGWFWNPKQRRTLKPPPTVPMLWMWPYYCPVGKIYLPPLATCLLTLSEFSGQTSIMWRLRFWTRPNLDYQLSFW